MLNIEKRIKFLEGIIKAIDNVLNNNIVVDDKGKIWLMNIKTDLNNLHVHLLSDYTEIKCIMEYDAVYMVNDISKKLCGLVDGEYDFMNEETRNIAINLENDIGNLQLRLMSGHLYKNDDLLSKIDQLNESMKTVEAKMIGSKEGALTYFSSDAESRLEEAEELIEELRTEIANLTNKQKEAEKQCLANTNTILNQNNKINDNKYQIDNVKKLLEVLTETVALQLIDSNKIAEAKEVKALLYILTSSKPKNIGNGCTFCNVSPVGNELYVCDKHWELYKDGHEWIIRRLGQIKRIFKDYNIVLAVDKSKSELDELIKQLRDGI